MLRKKNIEIDTKSRTIFITDELTKQQKKYSDTLVKYFGYAIQTKMSFAPIDIEEKKINVLIVDSDDFPEYYKNCIPSSKNGLLIHKDAKLLDNEEMKIKNLDVIYALPEIEPTISNGRGVIQPNYYKKDGKH